MLNDSSTTRYATVTRGLSGARWQLAVCDEFLLARLHKETGEPPILLRSLINRGLTQAAEISRFLTPDFNSHLHAPGLLRDMGLAVERLHRAVRDRERVLIVTDFDVDGTTSSVILSNALKVIGGDGLITCYVPDRFTEGYGLSRQIIEKAAGEGFRVIVTADIGIKSHAEARLAREHGIDLIICDHHLPDGEDVPADAYAVLCPKGSSGTDYPNKHLAACGVSLKLADALLEGHAKRDAILASLAKLTAIGTIADLVDLSACENRAIVRHGLRALNERSSNPGLRALLDIAKVGNPLTAYDVGFKIGPRINAAGRIAHASTVLNLFAARTDAEAEALARELDDLNVERQQIQHTLMEKLFKSVSEPQSHERVLVFAGSEQEGYHRGVVGIACSKLVENTGRPTFICAINDSGLAHGSARSINGFHIVEAMENVSELLIKFGGHPMAAGFTIAAEKIDEFRHRLNRYAEEMLGDEDLGRVLSADAELHPEQVTIETARALTRLEPHGMGNPAPLFLIRHAPLRGVRVMKEKHLKLQVGSASRQVTALWWNAVKYQPHLARASSISLMCSPEINLWNGRESVQLKVKDAVVEV
ncbi:MAG TPA: single-stranded-DNA-specific exonuclease RecJ [Blastocatellia bacterium]|nr:single-stranded-DNA-specific exonuclease RecJ [Blastocatellia bacterium]